MTAAETKAAIAQRGANPNLVSAMLWVAFMTMIIGEGAFEWEISGSQWIHLALLGGLAGDAAKILANRISTPAP